jgi:hypothetical protein
MEQLDSSESQQFNEMLEGLRQIVGGEPALAVDINSIIVRPIIMQNLIECDRT